MGGKIKLGFAVLEKRIIEFIKTYGVPKLIEYLEDYKKEYNARDYRLFQELREITCRHYGIPQAELMPSFIKPVHADARMCIFYITYVNTRLNQEAIAKLMKVSRSSVASYCETVEYRLYNVKQFRSFNDSYQKILAKFITIKSIMDGRDSDDRERNDSSGDSGAGAEEQSPAG